MLTTPHAVAGAALGALIGNPLLTVPVAVASHFVLDMVPHWQETLAPYTPSRKTWVRVPIDMALAIGLVGLMAYWQPEHAAAIWVGGVAGNLPDIDVVTIIWPQLKTRVVSWYWDWHCAIQRETGSLWGVVPQLIVIACGLLVAWWGRP